MNFWRWYFRRDWSRNPLWLLLAVATVCLAILNIARYWREFQSELWIMESPFAIAAFTILVASNVDLNFMEYKLEKDAPAPPPLPRLGLIKEGVRSWDWSIKRQKVIAAQYKKTFGTDLFYRFWQWRFAFMACWIIAMANWTWKNILTGR
jgi:hypothetical protein